MFFVFLIGIRSKRERSASRVLPYIKRAKPMWEYEPKDPATVQHLFGTTLDKIRGQLFQSQK